MSAKPGTKVSTSSWQVAITSRVRPTRSRTVFRTRFRARACSCSVTSTTVTVSPRTVPCGSWRRNTDTDPIPSRPCSEAIRARTRYSRTGTPLSSTPRSISSTSSGADRPAYASAKCNPTRPSTDTPRMLRAAELTRTTRSPVSRTCSPTGDRVNKASKIAPPTRSTASPPSGVRRIGSLSATKITSTTQIARRGVPIDGHATSGTRTAPSTTADHQTGGVPTALRSRHPRWGTWQLNRRSASPQVRPHPHTGTGSAELGLVIHATTTRGSLPVRSKVPGGSL